MSARPAALARLIRIERLKLQKRPAFWLIIGLFVALVASQYWWIQFMARGDSGVVPLGLPEGWRRQLYLAKVVAVFFVPLTVILATAGEFRLRTARQAVADGMTRREFVLAKVAVLVGVVSLFWVLSLILGLLFGLLAQSPPGAASIVRAQDAQLFAGYLAALFGYGALGLALSVGLRSTGAGVVAFGLYVVAVDGIVGSLLAVHDRWVVVARLLPTRVFDSLVNPARYEAGILDAVRLRFGQANVPYPELSSTTAVYLAAMTWVLLLTTATFFLFTRRDL